MDDSQKKHMTPLAKAIFNLLKQKGPLCPCQISVELFMSSEDVMDNLRALRNYGLVDIRPDRKSDFNYRESEIPWGLAINLIKKHSHQKEQAI